MSSHDDYMEEFFDEFEKELSKADKENEEAALAAKHFKPVNRIPEDNLYAAAAWLNSDTSEEELLKIQEKIKNHKKKLDVFGVVRAQAVAARFADTFDLLYQVVLPKLSHPATLEAMTVGQLQSFADLLNRILVHDNAIIADFSKTGPQEIPPLVQKNTLELLQKEESPASKAASKFTEIEPKERENVRLLVNHLESIAKDMLKKKKQEQ